MPPLLTRASIRWVIPVLVLAAVLQLWASEPVNLNVLLLVSWVPAIWILTRLEGRAALFAGWLAGAAGNAAIFYWLVPSTERFTGAPWPVGVLALAFFALAWGGYGAIFGLGARAVRRASGPWWPVTIALWFVACEFLNPQLFPYYQGSVFHQETRLFLLVSLTGIAGFTFVALVCNGLIAALIEKDGAAARRAGAVFAGLILLAAGWSSFQLARVEEALAQSTPFTAAMIQPNQSLERMGELKAAAPKGSKTYLMDDFLKLSEEADQQAPGGGVDVFVWGEGAMRSTPESPRNRSLLNFARRTGAELWLGSVYSKRVDGQKKRWTAAYRVAADGSVSEPYHKNILLPFGEFVPLGNLIPALKKIPGPGNYEAGTELTLFETPHARFAYLVCYEAIRSRYLRDGVARGANLLVNGSYEGWYGNSNCQPQFLMLTAGQAASLGVPMIRAGTTGISAVIDPAGRILEQSENWSREALISEVRPARAITPYARLGDWFAWLAVLGSFLLFRRGMEPLGDVRDRRAIWGLAVFLGAVPLGWMIIPSVPVLDMLIWGFAVFVTAGIVRASRP